MTDEQRVGRRGWVVLVAAVGTFVALVSLGLWIVGSAVRDVALAVEQVLGPAAAEVERRLDQRAAASSTTAPSGTCGAASRLRSTIPAPSRRE